MNEETKTIGLPEEKYLTQEQTLAVVQWVTTKTGLPEVPDETLLFSALRTCDRFAKESEGAKSSAKAAVSVLWKQHWQTIRDYLVEANMGLAYSIVRRMGNKANEDDLISDALWALTQSVIQFNPWKGFRFSTYACTVITRDLVRCCKRERTYRRLFPVQNEVNMELPTGEIDASSELKGLYVERLKHVLGQNIGRLSTLESQILSQRFSEGSDGQRTLAEIGGMVGLSRERVRQIQNSALAKLRRVLNEDPVLQKC